MLKIMPKAILRNTLLAATLVVSAPCLASCQPSNSKSQTEAVTSLEATQALKNNAVSAKTYSKEKDPEFIDKFSYLEGYSDFFRYETDVQKEIDKSIEYLNQKYDEIGTFAIPLDKEHMLAYLAFESAINQEIAGNEMGDEALEQYISKDELEAINAITGKKGQQSVNEMLKNSINHLGEWHDYKYLEQRSDILWNNFIRNPETGEIKMPSAEECSAQIDKFLNSLKNVTPTDIKIYRQKVNEFKAKQKQPNTVLGMSRLLEYKMYLIEIMQIEKELKKHNPYFSTKEADGIYKRVAREIEPKPY